MVPITKLSSLLLFDTLCYFLSFSSLQTAGQEAIANTFTYMKGGRQMLLASICILGPAGFLHNSGQNHLWLTLSRSMKEAPPFAEGAHRWKPGSGRGSW